MTCVHYSSATDMWETPQAFFDAWNKEFNFDLDVCATDENAKCPLYYTKEKDGLSNRWAGTVWINPPYGKEIIKWMRKAYESARDGDATVVCLVPARTDTAWWHDYAMKGDITFIRGRLKFGNAKNSAPFPSAVVVFEQAVKGQK